MPNVTDMPDKKEAKVGKWRVVISPSMKYGFFEHDDDGEGGGLWFDKRELVDQDGTYCLPRDAAKAIRSLGYKVPATYVCGYKDKPRAPGGKDVSGVEWSKANPSPNARDRVKVVTGEKIRTFGGWYRHDKVMLDGREIGRIQTRRRNKRTETITLGPDPSGSPNGGAVLGSDIGWLLRIAGEKA